YLYLDSGAMYRAMALKALERKIPIEDEAALEALTRETRIEMKPPTPEQETAGLKNRVFLDGREVTEEIRTAEVAQAASRLATIAGVREVLVAEQQRAGQHSGAGKSIRKRARKCRCWKFCRKCARETNGTGNEKFRRLCAPRMPCCWIIQPWVLRRRRG